MVPDVQSRNPEATSYVHDRYVVHHVVSEASGKLRRRPPCRVGAVERRLDDDASADHAAPGHSRELRREMAG